MTRSFFGIQRVRKIIGVNSKHVGIQQAIKKIRNISTKIYLKGHPEHRSVSIFGSLLWYTYMPCTTGLSFLEKRKPIKHSVFPL